MGVHHKANDSVSTINAESMHAADTLFLFKGKESFARITRRISLTPQSINRTISVIIPTMNEDTAVLEEQIAFLQQQSYAPMEIIIVLDNPKRKFSREFSRAHHVRIITHHKNLGRSAARNTGARNAQGELLVFADTGVVFHNSDTLERINRFYSNPHNSRVILKPRVLPHIEHYGTHAFICGTDAAKAKFARQENFSEERFSAVQDFESNFFAVAKQQFEKYPFDEEYGTRWGWEDTDWIRGQLVQDSILVPTGTIVAKTGLHAIEEDIIALIHKQVLGIANLRRYERRWKKKFPKETALLAKEYLYGKHKTAQEYRKLFRKSSIAGIMAQLISTYRDIHARNAALYLIPKRLSYRESEVLWEIIRTAMAYTYHHDEKELHTIVTHLAPLMQKNTRNPFRILRDSLHRRRIQRLAPQGPMCTPNDFALWERFSCAIKKQRRISIIIPTMGECDELAQQIATITKQSYAPMEIIIVLDNPLEAERMQECAQKEGGIVRVITHPQNLGRSAARNTGARNARGDILVFLDTGVLLHDTDILERINAFYGDPRNENVILKPRVLANIEEYGTYEFLTNNYEYPFRFSVEEGTEERTIDNFPAFLSNFFIIRKERFQRYPFAEEFGTRWGAEDCDWAIGQINTSSTIIHTNSIVGLQQKAHTQSLERHIHSKLEGIYNHILCGRKWERSVFSKILTSCRHYYIFTEDWYRSRVIATCNDPQAEQHIRRYVEAYRALRKEYAQYSLIPQVCAMHEMRLYRFITALITYYASTHFSTWEEYQAWGDALCR